jgi:phospholipase/lecithinase/hemolysin
MPELGVLVDNPKEPREATATSLFAATAAHNAALAKVITQLQKQGDIFVGTFHAGELNQATIDDPKTWGFSRLDAPCYEGSLRGEFYGKKEFCAEPSRFKFWEFTHPNSKMHCYYASQFLFDLAKSKVIAEFSLATAVQRCQGL